MLTSAKNHTLPRTELMYSPLFAEVRKDPRFEQVLIMISRKLPPAS
jgi:hypothetical protein